MAIVCAGCERPIYDKFMLTIVDRTWHAKCVKCAECQMPLSDNCYVRDGRIFCKADFFKRYGTQCGACSHPLAPDEMVRRATDRVYHLKCFRCLVCKRQMNTGEEYFILDPTRFMCKEDYLTTSKEDDDDDPHEVSPSNDDSVSETGPSTDSAQPIRRKRGRRKLSNSSSQGTPLTIRTTRKRKSSTKSEAGSESDEDDDKRNRRADDCEGRDDNESTNGSNDKKVRVPRTCIKDKQLEVLSSCFSSTPKPSRQVREQLAEETGLTMRVIQVWFQNKRSKERKLQQTGGGGGGGGGRGPRQRASPRRVSISSPPMSLHSEEASPGGTMPHHPPYFPYQENGHHGEFYRNHEYDEYPRDAGENEANMAAQFMSNAPASSQLQPLPDNNDGSGQYYPSGPEIGAFNNRSPVTETEPGAECVDGKYSPSPDVPLLELPQADPPTQEEGIATV